MKLNLIFVLFISSIVIASGSSCKNNEIVTVQNPKYFKSDKEYFLIHGLTNGESVVIYKIPDEQKVQVQYTFINDDCLYETTSYNINEKGSFVDYVKVLKKPEEFSISKTLSFIVDGKAVKINFEINKTGFVLNDVTGIKTFEPEVKKEDLCKEGSNVNVSTFVCNENSTELNYFDNGRFFYQSSFGSHESFIGKFVFKTSSDDFYTFDYNIFVALEKEAQMRLKSYNVKNSVIMRVVVENSLMVDGLITDLLNFCFNSTGVSIYTTPILKDSA